MYLSYSANCSNFVSVIKKITTMAKTIICPCCGHSDYYAYQPYKGDGRNGKTEYHCNECETDFFEGDEYENKFTQMDGYMIVEMVQTKSGN